MRRLFNSFFSLPRTVRFGIPAVVLLLVLAVVVGLLSTPTSTPATVSTVRPAAAPAAVSAAVPSAAQVPAVTAAAPPAPQTGAGATTSAIMRPALPPQTLRDCAREVLGLVAGSASMLETATFTATAEREDCKSPFASLSSKLPEEFASYAPGRGYLQITRSGIFKAERAGEHVFVLASPDSGTPRRCALYIGDLAAPLVEADRWSGQFATPAVAALEVGQHEVAVTCSFEIRNANQGSASVTASVRAPGDTSPRLVKLGLPEAAAPAAATEAAK